MRALLAFALACNGPADIDDDPNIVEQDDDDDDDDSTGALELTVVAFNVESGDARAEIVATVIEKVTDEHLWALQEVEDESWEEEFKEAAGDDFGSIMGSTGWEDRLVILYDRERLGLVKSEELHHINVGGTARAPLVGQFVDLETDVEFLFVNNHFWRSDDNARHQQATLLNEWATEQSLPIVTAGDFNFDYNINETYNDDGYDNLIEDGVFEWVKPDVLIETQCTGYYPSVLDFVFVAGDAQDWPGESEILETHDDYCDDNQSVSDHRPVKATFTF